MAEERFPSFLRLLLFGSGSTGLCSVYRSFYYGAAAAANCGQLNQPEELQLSMSLCLPGDSNCKCCIAMNQQFFTGREKKSPAWVRSACLSWWQKIILQNNLRKRTEDPRIKVTLEFRAAPLGSLQKAQVRPCHRRYSPLCLNEAPQRSSQGLSVELYHNAHLAKQCGHYSNAFRESDGMGKICPDGVKIF